jgi:hypothetical protein
MTAALVAAGVMRDASMVLAYEWRLGWRGQLRRVLGRRGVRAVQLLQLRYQWAYQLLAVEPRAGTQCWRWLQRCRGAPVKEALAARMPDAGVWDGHGAHTPRLLADLLVVKVGLPPDSAEFNPAEGVLQELRRRVEGRGYKSVADKQAVTDAYLTEPAANPARIRQLCGLALAHCRSRRAARRVTGTSMTDTYNPLL